MDIRPYGARFEYDVDNRSVLANIFFAAAALAASLKKGARKDGAHGAHAAMMYPQPQKTVHSTHAHPLPHHRAAQGGRRGPSRALPFTRQRRPGKHGGIVGRGGLQNFVFAIVFRFGDDFPVLGLFGPLLA
jgi:hypothetical protein